ncbi:MAG: hypothetical protein ACLPWG_24110, partial [Steroidobacteraceae bacterium]
MATVPAGSAPRTTALGNEASSSAVSWAAIVAGAFAALATIAAQLTAEDEASLPRAVVRGAEPAGTVAKVNARSAPE